MSINNGGACRFGHSFILAGALLLALLPGGSAKAGFATPCEGLVIETRDGSRLDEGWSSTGHDVAVSTGIRTSWAVLKRCSNNQEPCLSSGDCPGGTCAATCDCGADSTCEFTGPTDGRKCATTLADCNTNADCPASVACVHMFGPPQPDTIFNTPVCTTTLFEGEAGGTFHATTGETSLSAGLRRHVHVGGPLERPCPRCGTPAQDPQIGEVFTCEGGQFPGAVCTVEGVTENFGGTSSDCPPAVFERLTGTGLVFRFNEVTTGTTSKTAALSCAAIGFQANPNSPGSNPKCTDNTAGPVCASNADCTRCTGNPAIACSSNGDCTGNGTCAQAPDQPVTCGFWCHCGFCANNGSLPCFESSECPDGQACVKGTGTSTQANTPQQRPNDCSSDGYICGGVEKERCEDTTSGTCSLSPYRNCENNADCENVGAGLCEIASRTCFEPRITRAGAASPVGSYCAFEDKPCSSNADCAAQSGDFCAPDSARPRMAGLYCLPRSTNSTLNTAVGLAGPATIELESFVKVCRCNPGETGCDNVCGETVEECGDGIVQAGEDCDGGVCCGPGCAFASAATTCRGSAGMCDVAETCSGSSATCPANAFQSSATLCRASGGVCDVPESCTGSSATCPANALLPSTTTCRAAAGDCDLAEACDGATASCPSDSFKPDASPCDDGDACTTEECVAGECDATPVPDCDGVCGDGEVNSGEDCDDGNATFTLGEYCGVDCVLIPCGRPTNSMGVRPVSSDALVALRAAVGQLTCSPRVCDVDSSSSVVASDAQRILRAAVGQAVVLTCPTE